ncbi:unnamed protein product [Pedinophyceae sp. YPF-701]|nr:unnamed protein product [Pedinophyceae sp. YPF-701]
MSDKLLTYHLNKVTRKEDLYEALEEIDRLYASAGHRFNQIHRCTTIRGWCVLLCKGGGRLSRSWWDRGLRAVAELTHTVVERHTNPLGDGDKLLMPQGITNIVWGAGRLYETAAMRADAEELLRPDGHLGHAVKGIEQMLDLLVEMHDTRSGQVIPQAWANAVWGMAKLGIARRRERGVAEATMQAVITDVSQFMPQGLSNIVWALGTMGLTVKDPMVQQTLDAICSEKGLPEVLKSTSQGLSNTLWGMATCGYRIDSEVLARMMARATSEDHLNTHTAHGVSNVLWSVATFFTIDPDTYIPHKEVDALLGLVVKDRIRRKITTQGVSNCLWACATIAFAPSDRVMEVFVQDMCDRLEQYRAQGISNSLWALAKLRYLPPEDLLVRHAQIADELLPVSNWQTLSNTMYTWGSLGHRPPKEVFEKGAWEVVRRFRTGDTQRREVRDDRDDVMMPQHLLNVMWAAAVLDFRNAEWWQEVTGHVNDCHKNSQGIFAETLGSLAMVYAVNPIVRATVSDDLRDTMFNYWNGYMRVEASRTRFESVETAEAALQSYEDAMASGDEFPDQRASVGNVTISAMQVAVHYHVLKVLRALGVAEDVSCVVELLETESGLPVRSIDIAVMGRAGTALEGLRLAIEPDGHLHFMRNDVKRLMGGTILRDRDLTQRGWTVISIPYMVNGKRWYSMNATEKRAIVHGPIATALGRFLKTRPLAATGDGVVPAHGGAAKLGPAAQAAAKAAAARGQRAQQAGAMPSSEKRRAATRRAPLKRRPSNASPASQAGAEGEAEAPGAKRASGAAGARAAERSRPPWAEGRP